VILLIVSLLVGRSLPVERAQQCSPRRLIPAYAHNDYGNRHPLQDALSLGYQGVEADYILERGELLVGHGRSDLAQGRTLEQLYLSPLRERIGRCGWVQSPGVPFLLTIEYKERAPAGYRALRELLERYRDVVAPAKMPVPVRVVLVGWHPSLHEMAGEAPRIATVQARISRAGISVPEGDSALIGLVSLDYGKTMSWKGKGELSDADRQILAYIAEARRILPGRQVRAYDVPAVREVYQLLLSSGIDLIGTKELERTAEILRQ
jgi:alkaline phosphatase